MDDSPDIRESHAGTLELSSAMEPLKNSKQLVAVTRIEAYPVVANENDVLDGKLSQKLRALSRGELVLARAAHRMKRVADDGHDVRPVFGGDLSEATVV